MTSLNTFLVYIDRSTKRIVRCKNNFDVLEIPTGLKEYEIRYITGNINKNFINIHYEYTFSYIYGLVHSPIENINLKEINKINLRLSAIENLWKIGNMFIKNITMQYLHNELIYETLVFERKNNIDKDIDALTNFLRERDTELDKDDYYNLTTLHLNYIYEKKKDIIKNLLISQDKLISSEFPDKEMWEELKTIYIKY